MARTVHSDQLITTHYKYLSDIQKTDISLK